MCCAFAAAATVVGAATAHAQVGAPATSPPATAAPAPTTPAPAEAEDPRPQAALAACIAGQVDKGIGILADLYAETRNPSLVFNEGRCYQQNGMLEPARLRFAEYLRIGQNEPPQDLERARSYLGDIDAQLARAKQTTASGADAAAARAERRRRILRIGGVGLAGVGVAAIVTGIVFGAKVSSANSDIDSELHSGTMVDSAVLKRQLADGHRDETWQWIGYGVGAAALAGAAAALVFGRAFASGPPAQDTGARVSVAPLVSPGAFGGGVQAHF